MKLESEFVNFFYQSGFFIGSVLNAFYVIAM